nr:signal peptidase II [bacterium]
MQKKKGALGTLWAWFAVAALVLADQASKRWALAELAPVGTMEWIPGIMNLTFTKNTGAAFSLLEGFRLGFVVITVVSIGLILVLLLHPTYRVRGLGRVGLILVLAGAIGNFIDRLFYGYVVDFFDVAFMNFAIFNVADICITVGGALFVLGMLMEVIGHKENKEKEQDAHAGV